MAAISIWVGGLGVVLVVGARSKGPQFITVVNLFSRLAGIALVAAVTAGVGLTVTQLDSFSELWSSDYGRRLILKVALVGSVGGLGALHRYRTIPELEASGGTATIGFTRLAITEMFGFAAVLAATVWLVVGTS